MGLWLAAILNSTRADRLSEIYLSNRVLQSVSVSESESEPESELSKRNPIKLYRLKLIKQQQLNTIAEQTKSS